MNRWLITVLTMLFLAACSPPTPNIMPTTTVLPATATVPVPTPTVEVKPALKEAKLGILAGKVTVGPLTPVVKLDQPTPVPPAEVFTTRGIFIFQEDGKTLVQKAMFLGDGSYWLSLPPGTYVVDYIASGKDRVKNLPKPVTIRMGETTQLDLDIDTGIR